MSFRIVTTPGYNSKSCSKTCNYLWEDIEKDGGAILELLPPEDIMSNIEIALTLHGRHIRALKTLPQGSRSANLEKISKLFKYQIVALEYLPEAARASNIDKVAELNDEQAEIPELLNKDVRVKFLEKAKEFKRHHIDVLKSFDPSERNANFEKIVTLTAAQALIIASLPKDKAKYIDNISSFDWETAKTLSLLPAELRIALLEKNEIPLLDQYQTEALEALPPEKRADNIENIKLLEHRDCAAITNLGTDKSPLYLEEAARARHELNDKLDKYQNAAKNYDARQKIQADAIHNQFGIHHVGTRTDARTEVDSAQSSEKQVARELVNEHQEHDYGTDL